VPRLQCPFAASVERTNSPRRAFTAPVEQTEAANAPAHRLDGIAAI
jgi:hypothetical protein